jgi:hypothetical protein
MCKFSELSAGQNKFYEKVQEKVSLGFVLDRSCVHDCIVEEVCDLAGEHFRAVILANKSIMLGFEEESRQVFGLQLHTVVCDKCSTDDYGSKCDIV